MSEPISQYIDEFIEYSENLDVTDKVKEDRREVLSKLKAYLDEQEDDIFLDDDAKALYKVKSFFDSSASRSPNPPAISAITQFFEYLREEKEVYESNNVRNCISAVLTLKKTYDETSSVQRVERGRLSFDEREKVIRVCRNSDKEPLRKEVMLRLIMEAGLSRTELLALRAGNMEVEGTVNPAKIRIDEKWEQMSGKAVPLEEARYVAIGLDTRVKINELIDAEGREDADFLIWENPSYRKPKRRLEEILEAADLSEKDDLSIKDLQRNVIVDLIQKGVRQHKIQTYFESKNAVTSDVVDKFSLTHGDAHPLADYKRLF